MNRIVNISYSSSFGAGLPDGLDGLNPASIYSSNEQR
jgi:hypothetical protein